jgi:uncharacterized membrane protein YhdT
VKPPIGGGRSWIIVKYADRKKVFGIGVRNWFEMALICKGLNNESTFIEAAICVPGIFKRGNVSI